MRAIGVSAGAAVIALGTLALFGGVMSWFASVLVIVAGSTVFVSSLIRTRHTAGYPREGS